MRREPVDSSLHELRAERAEPEQLDELVDPLAGSSPRSRRRRAGGARRCSGSRTSTHRSSATAIVSSTVSAGRAGRPGTSGPARGGPGRCAGSVVMSTPPSSSRPPSAGVKPEMTSNSVVLPAPFGPDDAEDLARARPRCVTSSTARMPPKLRLSSWVASASLRRPRRGRRRRLGLLGLDGRGLRRDDRGGRLDDDLVVGLALERRLVDGCGRAGRRGALEEHRAQHVGPLEQLGGRARGSGSRPSP